MIVKDEAKVIERCLRSVAPFITTYCIVDTGSSDDTVTRITAFFAAKGMTGEVHVCPWVDFEYNRNEALTLARAMRPNDDELIIMCMDADEEFKPAKGFRLPLPMLASQYTCDIQHGCRFSRTRWYKATAYEWWYPIHEALCLVEGHKEFSLRLDQCFVDSHTDGARAKDPARWRKDAESLDAAIAVRVSGELWRGKALQLSRLYFYSGNSYFHALDYETAMARYLERIKIQEFPEEIFQAYYMLAKCKEHLQYSREAVVGAYVETWCVRPTRYEPIYHVMRYLMERGDYTQAKLFAARMLEAVPPRDVLFVEEWAYVEGKKLANMLLSPTPSETIDLATKQYIGKQWVEVLATLAALTNKQLKTLKPQEKFTYYDLQFIAHSWTGDQAAELVALRKIFELPLSRWQSQVLRLVGWYVETRGHGLDTLPLAVKAEYCAQKAGI